MAKKISEALEDESRVEAMQEEWLQFEIQKDERGWLSGTKLRLVAQGHRQEEGIDYDEIDEEVYAVQHQVFLDPKYPEKSTKCYSSVWVASSSRAMKDKHDIILVQVYVDDIIFGSTKKSWCDEFEALMKSRFQMSSMGELTFFLGLKVKQKPNGIFISQDKYVDGNPEEVCICKCFKSLKTSFKIVIMIGANLERKSTSGGCQFLAGDYYLACKIADHCGHSTTEADICCCCKCCGQRFPVYHSKTKHIAIRHTSLRDAYEEETHTDSTTIMQAEQTVPTRTGPRNCVVPNRKPKDKPRFNKGAKSLDKVGYSDQCKVYYAKETLEKKYRQGRKEMSSFISFDFLRRSYINHALTVSPLVSTTFVEQFWTSAKSKTINNVRHITAKVAGKSVSISEASIRTDLIFDDAGGIDTLPN
ncbi:putative ribonuclease H-like domain-containing protein [Tanacetum coccineum]